MGPDWIFELLQQYLDKINRVAKHYQLDTFPHQIEVVTSEQMMETYSIVGCLSITHTGYLTSRLSKPSSKHGHQKLAYEIVINSNSRIAHLIEENTLPMLAPVMAHAC